MTDFNCKGLQNLDYYNLPAYKGWLMSRCSIIALTAVLLIWVGYLLVRIYYGPNAINKLTMTPFYMTFAMLSAKLILEIVKVFVNAKTLC
jgi:hypothetical protein